MAAGCVHVYCGDGKGKTTAAVGLAVRAAGCKRRVLVTRFLKTENSGEVLFLRQMPGIEVTPCDKSFGFFFQMTDDQKKEAKEYYSQMLADTLKRAVEEDFDMLVMDEIMAASTYGLVDEEEVLSFLESRPAKLEVVLTGRDPSDQLLSLADYVTEMVKKKHPYDRGIGAREGIEY